MLPESVSSLSLVLVAGCNSCCSYCYQDARSGRTMSREVLCRALDFALGLPRPEVTVVFTGGEPLLAQDLMRFAVLRAGRGRPGGPVVRYAILTNGLLLNRALLSFMGRHDFIIRMSLDGGQAAQELRCAGTAKRLCAVLELMKADYAALFNRRLTINCVVTRQNASILADSVRFLIDLGCPGILVAPNFIHDSKWRPGDAAVFERQFSAICDYSARHYEKTGEIPLLAYAPGYGEPGSSLQDRVMCKAALGSGPVVDVDGETYSCSALVRSYRRGDFPLVESCLKGGHMGNIERLAARMAAGEKTAPSLVFLDKPLKQSACGRCRECEHYSSCVICPISTVRIPHNANPHRISDFACAFNRALLDSRARFHRMIGLMASKSSDPVLRFRSLVTECREGNLGVAYARLLRARH